MGALRHWALAARPKTLSIAVAPVAAGTALAAAQGAALSPPVLAATLGAALLIQVGTNLHNDVADFERGTDVRHERLGPPRATTEGWLTPSQVRAGAYGAFAAAFALGLYLVSVGGWAILLLGLLSLVAAWSYTGGPNPIAYGPLGEVFVWLFFGLGAVGGTFYLQAGELTPGVWLAGTIVGLPAAAVLTVNNHRDRETDREAGKRTLAVRLGPPATRRLYTLLIMLPLVLGPAGWWAGWLPVGAAATTVLLPWAVALVTRVRALPPGPGLNGLLAGTAAYQLVLALVLGAGLVLGRS